MDNEIGLKELYEVTLKATYPIEVEGRIIEKGETIAVFDEIQLSAFDELKRFISANGGFDNRARVWWEESKELRLNFSQGTFSKIQLALMTNANLINVTNEVINITKREVVESDESGILTLTHAFNNDIFIYNRTDGTKITNYVIIDTTHIQIDTPFVEVIVDYSYNYTDGGKILHVGQALTHGYLTLIGKTRIHDDVTGQVTTGILTIPKLKLMSDLSMRLGKNAVPMLGRLEAIAIPDGNKGEKRLMDFVFLNDDIDSDI